jgi:hypothetical protein
VFLAAKWHRILRWRSTGVVTNAFVDQCLMPSFAFGWHTFAYVPISITSGRVVSVVVRFSIGAPDLVAFAANRPGFTLVPLAGGAGESLRNIATVPGVPGAATGNIHGNQYMILPPAVAVFETTVGDPLVNVVSELWATLLMVP